MSWWFRINCSPVGIVSVIRIAKNVWKYWEKRICYVLLARWNLIRIKNVVSESLMGKESIYGKFTAIVNKEKFVLRIKDTMKHKAGTINGF